jgi:hypothetical protein
MATALLNLAGVPEPVGAMILSAFFPGGSDVPGYFTEVIQEIRDVVDQELVENDLTELSGQVASVITFVQDDYANEKNGPTPASNSTLYTLIGTQKGAIDGAVSDLTQPKLAQPGFSLFLSAASVQISIYQEAALTDPNAATPWDSDETNTIVDKAHEAVKFAKEQWPVLQAARHDAITLQQEVMDTGGNDNPGGTGGVFVPSESPTTCYWWEDSVAGTSSDHQCGDGNADDQLTAVQADMAKQQASALAELAGDLGGPDDIIAQWQGVAQFPIPLPCAAAIPVLGATYAPQSRTVTMRWKTADAAKVEIMPSAGDPQTVDAEGAITCQNIMSPLQWDLPANPLPPGFPADPAHPQPVAPPLGIRCTDAHGRELFQPLNCVYDSICLRDQSTGIVYLVLDDVLRRIPDPACYERLFRDSNNILSVANILGYDAGAEFAEDTSLAGGPDGKIYLLVDGQKRWVTSPDAFDRYNLNAATVQPRTADQLAAIPDGAAIDDLPS